MISVDPAVLAALSADGVRLAEFLELELDGGVFVRYSTAGAELLWQPPSAGAPVSWIGLGALLALDPIVEDAGLEALAWEVTLSGVPSDLLALAALEDVVGRPARAWVGVYDDSGVLVGPPILKFVGEMNDFAIEDDPKDSKVVLRVDSSLIWLLRASNEYWTNADQKKRFPTDDGFKFAEITSARTLRFGPAR